jgi:hypothetical protein
VHITGKGVLLFHFLQSLSKMKRSLGGLKFLYCTNCYYAVADMKSLSLSYKIQDNQKIKCPSTPFVISPVLCSYMCTLERGYYTTISSTSGT